MRILRTAIGSIVTWGMIEELLRLGVDVIGADCDPNSYAFHKINCYTVPKATDPKFIDRILDICEIEEIDAIISGPEEELLMLAKNRDLFEGITLLAPSYESLKICTDKLKSDIFLQEINIPTPERYEKDCIIKPRKGRGSRGIIEGKILQEYIKGKEYSIDILADREGNVLNMVPRLRQKVVDGKSVRSTTVWDYEMMEYCYKIVKGLKLFGPSCIQCIKNDSGIYFIDVNPRFGGGSILSIKADPTFIPNMIKLIKGEKSTPSLGYKENLTMLRYYKEVYVGGN